MSAAAAVHVVPPDLARVVDGLGRSYGAARETEDGVAAAVVEEAVGLAETAVGVVRPYDLACGVDGGGRGGSAARGVEGDVGIGFRDCNRLGRLGRRVAGRVRDIGLDRVIAVGQRLRLRSGHVDRPGAPRHRRGIAVLERV